MFDCADFLSIQIKKHMKLKKIFFLLIIVFILSTLSSAQNSSKLNSSGKIKGALFDSSGEAIIPGKKIVIEGQDIKQTITTNDRGEYEFDLPAGIYNIAIEEEQHYEWFYPFRRGKIEIRPNTISVINLYPAIIGKIIALVASSAGVRDEVTITTKPPKYENISVIPSSALDLVIQFSKKKIHKKITEYKNAKLTFGNLTIIAGEVQFDKSNLQIRAKGLNDTVLIDNNGQQSRVSEAKINIKDGVPIVL